MAVVYFVADELFRDHASEPEPRAKGRKNALIPDKGGVKTMAIHRMPAGRDWTHNFAVGNIKNAQDADISPYVFKREHRIFRRCKCEVTDYQGGTLLSPRQQPSEGVEDESGSLSC